MGFDKAGIRMRKRGTTAILEGTNEAVFGTQKPNYGGRFLGGH